MIAVIKSLDYNCSFGQFLPKLKANLVWKLPNSLFLKQEFTFSVQHLKYFDYALVILDLNYRNQGSESHCAVLKHFVQFWAIPFKVLGPLSSHQEQEYIRIDCHMASDSTSTLILGWVLNIVFQLVLHFLLQFLKQMMIADTQLTSLDTSCTRPNCPSKMKQREGDNFAITFKFKISLSMKQTQFLENLSRNKNRGPDFQ